MLRTILRVPVAAASQAPPGQSVPGTRHGIVSGAGLSGTWRRAGGSALRRSRSALRACVTAGLVLIAALGGVGSGLHSVFGDSAPQKNVQDWSTQEVLRFFQDSPWAKTVRVGVLAKDATDPSAASVRPVVGAVPMARFESCCRTFEVPVAGVNADSREGGSQGSPGNPVRSWTFNARVFWMSSVTVRRVMIRQRQLQGVPIEQADAALAPSSEFVLALSGPFLQLLEGIPPDQIKATSLLRAEHGSKRPLRPLDFVPAQPGAEPVAFLIFPKTLDGGPAFSRRDDALTFSMSGVDFNLECRFPLGPMVVDGQVDW